MNKLRHVTLGEYVWLVLDIQGQYIWLQRVGRVGDCIRR